MNLSFNVDFWLPFRIVFILFALKCNSQVVHLKGTISDTINAPIVYATILAKPIDNSFSANYAITNERGKFSLELIKNVLYDISISSLGFEELTFRYKAQEEIKAFTLKEKTEALDEIIIEMPITVKKDTIVYLADKFKSGDERKLKELLNKLPGIEIEDDGSVTSQGEKITHLLVENREFFGGDTKLGIESIPANSVDKIEVIDDYNNVAFLKGLNKTEDMALNIKLKENKKQFVFGDVFSGTGPGVENTFDYDTQLNLFYYRPELNINFIGTINNTGSKVFSSNDYNRFVGRPSSVFTNNDFNKETNIISESINDNSNSLKTQARIGALNLFKKAGNKFEISSYVIGSNLENEKLQITDNAYILQDSTLNENVVNTTFEQKDLAVAKLKFKYSKSITEQFSVKSIGKYSQNSNVNSIFSQVSGTNINLNRSTDIESNYFTSVAEWHKKIKKNRAFSSVLDLTYDNNNSHALWNTDRTINNNFIPFIDQNRLSLNLLRNVKKNNYNFVFKYLSASELGNIFHVTLGANQKRTAFFTEDSQFLDNGTSNSFDSTFGNNFLFKINDLYTGLSSDFSTNSFDFKFGLFLHNYYWSTNQINNVEKSKLVLLPNIQINTGSPSGKGSLTFQTNLRNSFSEASRFSDGFFIRSYNSVLRGNNNLDNEITHNSSIRFSKRSILSKSLFLGELQYNYSLRGVVNNIETSNQNRSESFLMLDTPENTFSGFLVYRKTFKNKRVALQTNFSSSKTTQIINNTITSFNNISASYKLSLRTSSFRFIPLLEFGIEQGLSVFGTENNRNRFITTEPYFKVKINLLKNFILASDYRFYNYQNRDQDIDNTYSLGNLSINYRKRNKPWQVQISTQNIFNTRFTNQSRFNVFFISDSRTFILPRILLFKLIYDI